jgi:hypothetical protein
MQVVQVAYNSRQIDISRLVSPDIEVKNYSGPGRCVVRHVVYQNYHHFLASREKQFFNKQACLCIYSIGNCTITLRSISWPRSDALLLHFLH